MPKAASAATITGGRARFAPSAIFNATARPSGSAAANTPSAPSLAIKSRTRGRMKWVTSRRSPPTISGMRGHRLVHGIARLLRRRPWRWNGRREPEPTSEIT